jgi:nucleoside-diphosphate-sugar epimerase
MTRVALTGGTGFVGANLVRALLRRGDEVHLLNRATHATWRIEEVRADIATHPVDIADADSVHNALHSIQPEIVFHLAQHGGYSWQTDAREMESTNHLAFINLLDAAQSCGVRAVVNAGTSSEYGLKDQPAREDDTLEPNSDYAATKAAATLHGQQVARQTGLAVVTLRLYSIYGPFEEPRRLMPSLVSLGLEGRLPPLAHPDTARDLVYVDDAVAAFIRAAETAEQHCGAIFNVCSGRQRTLREIVLAARRVLNIAAEPDWGTMPPRAWDTNCWVGNPECATRELGWTATIDMEAGLTRLADWLRGDPGLRERYRGVVT